MVFWVSPHVKRMLLPEEQIKIRQQRAAWEESQKDKYDYVVINDVLDDAVATVMNIISQNTKD